MTAFITSPTARCRHSMRPFGGVMWCGRSPALNWHDAKGTSKRVCGGCHSEAWADWAVAHCPIEDETAMPVEMLAAFGEPNPRSDAGRMIARIEARQ